MTDLPVILHSLLRWSHISLGFAGLVAFWIVVALPKGTPWHKRCGAAFAWCAKIVGGTAIISAAWAVLHVDSFAPFLARLDSARAAQLREIFAYFFLLLLFLGAVTVCAATFGVNVMRFRHRHHSLRRTALPFWEVAAFATAAWLAAFGALKLCGLGTPLTGALPWAAYSVPVILGVIGMLTAVFELRYIFGADPGGRVWLYKHVEQMCGAGTGFHTAFAVFGFSRITGIQFDGAWALAPWILTPAIGIVATSLFVRRLKRQHGDLHTSPPSQALEPPAPAAKKPA